MSQNANMSAGSTAAPSPKDGLFFLTILMNMRNKPEVDWDLVAQEAGYTNAHCASTRFGQMKKKFTSKNPSTPNLQSPNASFGSTSTIPNTPTGSPPKGSSPKKAKREVGSGTNVSSGRVKKSPVKGSSIAQISSAKAHRRGMNNANEIEGGDMFTHGNEDIMKYQDGVDNDEWTGYEV